MPSLSVVRCCGFRFSDYLRCFIVGADIGLGVGTDVGAEVVMDVARYSSNEFLSKTDQVSVAYVMCTVCYSGCCFNGGWVLEKIGCYLRH